ncbi:hypothetical protein FB451DRAFT_1169121 [Mycena latifolia]|nr:hypothetical protein FB451DRAFT_1169121 [Mycena latifolia]
MLDTEAVNGTYPECPTSWDEPTQKEENMWGGKKMKLRMNETARPLKRIRESRKDADELRHRTMSERVISRGVVQSRTGVPWRRAIRQYTGWAVAADPKALGRSEGTRPSSAVRRWLFAVTGSVGQLSAFLPRGLTVAVEHGTQRGTIKG